MKAGGIDSSRIEAMIAQLKAAATKPQNAVSTVSPVALVQPEAAATKVDFSAALQSAIGAVSDGQKESAALGRRFAMGDDSVSLSDVMITSQKAGIAFQATVQVRNKMVQAYQEIMNMQV